MNQLPEHYCTLFAHVAAQADSCQALLSQLDTLSKTPSLPLQAASALQQAKASLALIYEQLVQAQLDAEEAFLEEDETLLLFPTPSAYGKQAI